MGSSSSSPARSIAPFGCAPGCEARENFIYFSFFHESKNAGKTREVREGLNVAVVYAGRGLVARGLGFVLEGHLVVPEDDGGLAVEGGSRVQRHVL